VIDLRRNNMIRRQFLKLATLTGATGVASLAAIGALRTDSQSSALNPNGSKTVKWRVRGFTCVTCAVGLETLLRREKGVVAADATYPEGMVTIQYHAAIVSEAALRSTIAEMGFTVDDKKG
jgi:copper chaperone CopZ